MVKDRKTEENNVLKHFPKLHIYIREHTYLTMPPHYEVTVH